MGKVSASVEIQAEPAVVYALISDVVQLPCWAAETTECRWLDGAEGPAVGAKFRGTNRIGRLVWRTTCTVTEAEPGRCFAWRVTAMGGPVAEWRYELEPTADGCRVTESARDLRNAFLRRVIGPLITKDRAGHNQRNIEKTLADLKVYAESVRSA